MAARNRRNSKTNKTAMRCVTVVVLLLLVVMSINIVRLYQRDEEYAQKEQNLTVQYEEETKREKDLLDFEAFTKTLDYVEEVAREKLGMVFENEIVFKSKSK